jgi:hypothetical protein
MPDLTANHAQNNNRSDVSRGSGACVEGVSRGSGGQANLTDAFTALCASRAYRYGQGELNMLEAVDFLYDWAFARGLSDELGDDAVQHIMTEAFRPYRED